MAFNVSDFRSQIASVGLSKNNLFFVRISLPSTLKYIEGESGIDGRVLEFLCKSVNVPEMEVVTTDIKPYSYGASEKRPIDFTHSQLATIFMVDAKFATLKFFHRWIQSVYNYEGTNGLSAMDSRGKLAFEFEYKENYAATIDVFIYSSNAGDMVYNYKYLNAYPTTVGNIDASWENQGDILPLPVSFTYDRISVTGAEIPGVSDVLNRGNGLITSAAQLNTLIQAIKILDYPTDVQDALIRANQLSTILKNM